MRKETKNQNPESLMAMASDSLLVLVMEPTMDSARRPEMNQSLSPTNSHRSHLNRPKSFHQIQTSHYQIHQKNHQLHPKYRRRRFHKDRLEFGSPENNSRLRKLNRPRSR
jgi:hypothetical protein